MDKYCINCRHLSQPGGNTCNRPAPPYRDLVTGEMVAPVYGFDAHFEREGKNGGVELCGPEGRFFAPR